jgi:hypothetical protein
VMQVRLKSAQGRVFVTRLASGCWPQAGALVRRTWL